MGGDVVADSDSVDDVLVALVFGMSVRSISLTLSFPCETYGSGGWIQPEVDQVSARSRSSLSIKIQ